MFGNRGLADGKRLRELRHRRFASRETGQNGPPRRIGKREKRRVECSEVLLFIAIRFNNYMVI